MSIFGDESWYIVQINPYKHDYILREIHKFSYDENVEINYFNPHYIPKRKPKNASSFKSKSFHGTQVYDGYLYIYIEDEVLRNSVEKISSISGVIKVFEQPITQEEFDNAYDTVMKLRKAYKAPRLGSKNKINYDFLAGDKVVIVSGGLDDMRGTVKEYLKDRDMIKVSLKFFGKETTVILNPAQVIRDV